MTCLSISLAFGLTTAASGSQSASQVRQGGRADSRETVVTGDGDDLTTNALNCVCDIGSSMDIRSWDRTTSLYRDYIPMRSSVLPRREQQPRSAPSRLTKVWAVRTLLSAWYRLTGKLSMTRTLSQVYECYSKLECARLLCKCNNSCTFVHIGVVILCHPITNVHGQLSPGA